LSDYAPVVLPLLPGLDPGLDPGKLSAVAVELVAAGKTIAAIKPVHTAINWDLKTVKEYVMCLQRTP
jgi:hypothetical protein